MTPAKKKSVAKKAWTTINKITTHFCIAGGYPRDIIVGEILPKDIDVFINSNEYPTIQARDELADKIFKAFGQTWTKDGEPPAPPRPIFFNTTNNVAPANPYGPETDVQAQDQFSVYFAATNDGSWENLNLIFSAGNRRASQFDFGFCQFFIEGDGRIYYDARDVDYRNIRIMNFERVPQSIAHGLRLRAKYPEAKFKMTAEMCMLRPRDYLAYIDGGLIDVPRQVLPAQGEIPLGDGVRLDTGTQAAPTPEPPRRANLPDELERINAEGWPQPFNVPTPRWGRTGGNLQWTNEQLANWAGMRMQEDDIERVNGQAERLRAFSEEQRRIRDERLRDELLLAGRTQIQMQTVALPDGTFRVTSSRVPR